MCALTCRMEIYVSKFSTETLYVSQWNFLSVYLRLAKFLQPLKLVTYDYSADFVSTSMC